MTYDTGIRRPVERQASQPAPNVSVYLPGARPFAATVNVSRATSPGATVAASARVTLASTADGRVGDSHDACAAPEPAGTDSRSAPPTRHVVLPVFLRSTVYVAVPP